MASNSFYGQVHISAYYLMKNPFYATLLRLKPIDETLVITLSHSFYTLGQTLQGLRKGGVVILLALLPLAATAAQEDSHPFCIPPELSEAPSLETLPEGDESIQISADQVTAKSKAVSSFQGNVSILRRDSVMEASRADYDKTSDTLELDENIRYRTPTMYLTADHASINISEGSGRLENPRFQMLDLHAFGEAEVMLEEQNRIQLENTLYSTCPPGQKDWYLKAGKLVLDRDNNIGTARKVSITFKGVPFMYLPYISFPLEGRKTGFLLPDIGHSSSSGTDISLPYYWNIAPHRDATTTPRYISKRGSMLETEFRYLNPNSAGMLNVDTLPDDKLYGDDRLSTTLHHDARLGRAWQTSLDYRYVSDTDYFNDLGNSQGNTSLTHLERRLDLSYQGQNWRFQGLVQDHQTLSGVEPYRRLPQLRLTAASPKRSGKLQYAFAGEWVSFEHEDPLHPDPDGSRLDLYPSLSLPLQGSAWFLTPRLASRYTQYQLVDVIGDESPSRNQEIASLDAGLFFERELKIAGQSVQQTLEPRLYYLHVPYDDQSNLPVFDSSALDFSFSQLFRENRFSGADRMGDAEQLTLALSSRLNRLDNGRELARVSLGQIFYYRDREVTILPAPVETEESSSLVGELALQPRENLALSTTVQWNPHQDVTEQLGARLIYRPEPRRALSLNYRLRRDQALRQTDLVALWPLSQHWHFLGRWNYDLETEQSLDTLAGLEYQSCCWGLRLTGRAQLNTSTQEIDRSIYLSLELKGLANIGQRLDSELERGILGYD